MSRRSVSRIWGSLVGLALAGCAGATVGPATQPVPTTPQETIRSEYGTMHGEDGFTLFGGNKPKDNGGGGGGGGGPGIGVNATCGGRRSRPSTSCRWCRPIRSAA